MITIKFMGRTPSPAVVKIGMETDSRAETLEFILPKVADAQTAQLMMLLPDGQAETLLLDGNMVLLPASVAAIPGRIRAYVEILGDDRVVWNSDTIMMDIGDLPGVEESITEKYPTALQNAMDASVDSLRYKEKAQMAAALVLAGSELWNMRVEGDALIIDHALPENAYEIAVRNGYTGTEEQWNALVASVSDYASAEEARSAAEQAQEDVDALSGTVEEMQGTVEEMQGSMEEMGSAVSDAQSAASDAQTAADSAQDTADTAAEAAAEASALAAEKAKVSTDSFSVPASAWSSTAPYTATVACEIATESNTLIVGIGGSITAAQKNAISMADIVCTGQGDGTITLTAFGTKPLIAIPVNVMGVE